VPPVTTRAVILHSFAYGETSRILRLLTADHGLRSAIAKGARSPKGRFGGLLEPFTEGEAQFSIREGRDLSTLTGFSLVRGRQSIGRDLTAFSGASLVAEVLLRFATDEPQPELFSSAIRTFDLLGTEGVEGAAVTLAALWSITSIFGFEPEWRCCVRCGREMDGHRSARFDVDSGGVACIQCRPVGRPLSPAVLDDLVAMCSRRETVPDLQDRRLHADIVSAFLSTHVLHGQPLRSLSLFLDQVR